MPDRLLVVGGGIIGLEMACVYDALGSRVSVVELTDELMPGCDRDLVRPLQKRISERYETIMLGTAWPGSRHRSRDSRSASRARTAPAPERYDKVLMAVGRRANGDLLEAEAAGVEVGSDGVIAVDGQRPDATSPTSSRSVTSRASPMLAHKAMHEGIVAAEVIAGEDVTYDPRSIPSVAYTDPEVAWTGLTETEASEQGRQVREGQLPVAGERPGARDRAGRGPDQDRSSTPNSAPGASAPERSGSTPAS